MGTSISRERLLARRPEELVPVVLDRGPAWDDYGTASLVFAYHLKAGAVPREALDLCLVGFAAAQDDPWPDARERLDRVLAIQTDGIPVLEPWIRLLVQGITDPERLHRAVHWLEHVRRTWMLLEIGEIA